MTSTPSEEHSLPKDLIDHAVSASVLDYIDREVIASLRDGRLIVGTLGNFDQFNNIVLTEASERFIHNGKFADKHIGVMVIRGEFLAYIGLLRGSRSTLTRVSTDELFTERSADLGGTPIAPIDVYSEL